MKTWKEFRTFVARGNVVDLAVAVVIGTAFTAVVTAIVTNLLTPLLSIAGKSNFASLHFTVHGSTFSYGLVVNAVISFLLVAAAVFFLVVKPLNSLQARRARGKAEPDPVARQCPECLSDIPVAARRCAFCTAVVAPVVPAADGSEPAAGVTA